MLEDAIISIPSISFLPSYLLFLLSLISSILYVSSLPSPLSFLFLSLFSSSFPSHHSVPLHFFPLSLPLHSLNRYLSLISFSIPPLPQCLFSFFTNLLFTYFNFHPFIPIFFLLFSFLPLLFPRPFHSSPPRLISPFSHLLCKPDNPLFIPAFFIYIYFFHFSPPSLLSSFFLLTPFIPLLPQAFFSFRLPFSSRACGQRAQGSQTPDKIKPSSGASGTTASLKLLIPVHFYL